MVPVIGFIGTAKNTGKTTALAATMAAAAERGKRVVVTGIGYDGEVIDNLTELPKPRLHFPEGAFVATAAAFLDSSDARVEKVKSSHITNALGEMVLGRVVKEGKLVIAGPPTRQGLAHILPCLRDEGDLVLVDGSISRLVPLMEADAVIVTTGAARNTDLSVLAQEAKGIDAAFHLPRCSVSEIMAIESDNVTVLGDGLLESLPFSSLLSDQQWQRVGLWCSKGLRSVYVPGVLLPQALVQWVTAIPKESQPVEVVVEDPASLIAGINPALVLDALQAMRAAGIRLSCRRPVPLLALLINPFYPKEKSRGHSYEAAYVDANILRAQIDSQVTVPVVNVLHDGVSELLDAMLRVKPVWLTIP